MAFCISCFRQFSFRFLLSSFFLSKTETGIACPECTYSLVVQSFAAGEDVSLTLEGTLWNPCRVLAVSPDCCRGFP